MRKIIYSVILLPFTLLAQNTATGLEMAAKPDPGRTGYTEQVMVGLFFEGVSLSDYVTDFRIMDKPYNVQVDADGHFGIIGLMPLNPWITLTAQAGYQKINFQYKARNLEEAYSHVTGVNPVLDSSDVEGKSQSNNVIAQLGIEAGLPLYSSDAHSLLVKFYSFGTGMGGKMFLDNTTKFENGNLWGYSWGGGLRVAWKRIAVMGGMRSSHGYWRIYFDPSKKTGDQLNEDTFMLDYNANFNPFISFLVAFN